MHGELAGAGAEEPALDADVVAEVEELVHLEGALADVILAHVDLQAHAALLQLREAGLALQADGHDAAGDRDLHRDVGLELGARDVVEGSADLGDGVAGGVGAGIARLGCAETAADAELGDLAQLVAAERVEVLFKLGFGHGSSLSGRCRSSSTGDFESLDGSSSTGGEARRGRGTPPVR